MVLIYTAVIPGSDKEFPGPPSHFHLYIRVQLPNKSSSSSPHVPISLKGDLANNNLDAIPLINRHLLNIYYIPSAETYKVQYLPPGAKPGGGGGERRHEHLKMNHKLDSRGYQYPIMA